MPTCEGCGGHVTEQYRRVFFADGEPVVCPDCTSLEDLCEHKTEVPDDR